MIVEFRFKRTLELSPSQESALRNLVGPLEYDKDGDLKRWASYRAPVRELLEITDQIEILEKVEPTHLEQIAQQLRDIEQKVARYSQGRQHNDVVNVHISDVGMMQVRYVEYLLDACTEDLQTYLDEGWRIIAVCPQPDQRRPDYILGNSELPR